MMRKGFTLVELLIVIVVIGVLASMMIYSSTEAVASAKATKVINDMAIMKRAVTAWYTDNIDRVKRETWQGTYVYKVDGQFLGVFAKDKKGDKEFKKYFTSGQEVKLTKDNYTQEGDFFLAAEGPYWYVGYDTGTNMALREKIAFRAKSQGLMGGVKKLNADGSVHTDTASITAYNPAVHQKVYMLIMSF